jgi:8-hydroxy-5-deazaflavin:NADPH oxidoreductase
MGTSIGIIGAGHIGATLARLYASAGHEVVVSNSRGPETLSDLVAEIGHGVRAVTSAEAAAFGDLVVVSVPLRRYREVPREGLDGKTVVDTNNYYPSRDGQFPELDADSTTSSELLARHLPGAHVVKAYNQIRWEHLRERGRPAGSTGRLAIPIAGDDDDSKQTVTALNDEIGFDSVDLGPLSNGRLFQPGASLYVADTTADKIHALVAERDRR